MYLKEVKKMNDNVKTIVDIMAICYDTIGTYCGGSACLTCNRLSFCYVNSCSIAFLMIFETGDYH